MTSSCDDKCLKFWNSNDYSNISTINNIETEWTFRTLCLIKEDILCVGPEFSCTGPAPRCSSRSGASSKVPARDF